MSNTLKEKRFLLIIKLIIGIPLWLFTIDGILYLLSACFYFGKPRLFFITFGEFMFALHNNRSYQISSGIITLIVFVLISGLYAFYILRSSRKKD